MSSKKFNAIEISGARSECYSNAFCLPPATADCLRFIIFGFHNIWHCEGESEHKSHISDINPGTIRTAESDGREAKNVVERRECRKLLYCQMLFRSELEIHKTPYTIIGCVEVVSLNLIKDLPPARHSRATASICRNSATFLNSERSFIGILIGSQAEHG